VSDSISFDRAAEYYDQTRSLSEEGVRRQTGLLLRELGGRGQVLEIGVGTGQVALPLAEAGVPLIGLDLSRAMMDRLMAKAGGEPPFPLVQGDATRLPFRDGAFGGGLLRWVLHLIPNWRGALEELVRVTRSGGVLTVQLGGPGGGRRAEIQERFGELAGISRRPVGLMWGSAHQMDEAMAGHGATGRLLRSHVEPGREALSTYLDALETNRYSWTWGAEEEARRRAAAEVRAWAEDRWGPLEEVLDDDFEIVWHAYDLP
jgi:SAM-dependent methyltransferase